MPEWNKNNQYVKHDIKSVDIGWTKVTSDTGDANTILCYCEYGSAKSQQKFCYYEQFNETSDEEDTIYVNDCQVMSTYTEETLHMNKATELLRRGGNNSSAWLKPGESVILDIDEDYFGCELPGQLLYDAGMVWSDVEALEIELRDIFCLKTTEHEQKARKLMNKGIETLVDICSYSSSSGEVSECPKNFLEVFKEITTIFKQSWETDHVIYCDITQGDVESALKQFFHLIYALSSEKVLAIRKVEFCLETTPNSTFFGETGEFQICHGANDPKEPLVEVYVPDKKELVRNIEEMQEFLTMLPLPGTVTLCRSVRDGYTPRSIFRIVENNLTSFFLKKSRQTKVNKRYINKNLYNIQYDANLLNGIHGLAS